MLPHPRMPPSVGGVASSKCSPQEPRRNRVRRHELLERHLVDRPGAVAVGALLQPARRRRTGQRLHPASRRLQRRIVAQLAVVVQIPVPRGQRVGALPEQLPQRVPDTGPPPSVIQPSRHRSSKTSDPAVERSPQTCRRLRPSLVRAPPAEVAAARSPRPDGLRRALTGARADSTATVCGKTGPSSCAKEQFPRENDAKCAQHTQSCA